MFFFFQAEDGIRDHCVTGVQTCALPISVRELMTPRTSIVAIPEGLLAAEAAHVCLQSGYSRYPVYRGSLDEVIGVAHAFDLLRSEEHTSELQSHSDLVCRLLLEKKKESNEEN